MGIFDNLQMVDQDSPEMARALALLQAAGLMGSPMKPGENIMSKLTQSVGGGLTTYLAQMEKQKRAKLELEDDEQTRQYNQLKMAKMYQDIHRKENKEKSIKDWLDEETGHIDESQQMSVPDPQTRRQKWGNKADLMEYQSKTGLTLPGNLFEDRQEVDVDGRQVALTNKQMIDLYLKERTAEFNEGKKTVKSAGYGKQGVYDSQGNVTEMRDIPVRPTSAKSGNGNTKKKAQAKLYLTKKFESEGAKRKTPEQQEISNQLERRADALIDSGKEPEAAVKQAINEWWKKNTQSKPKATTGTFKTPNGTARIVKE